MEYYKIIYNNAIVGAVTSKQFMRYASITNCLVRCTKQQGQYITYEGKLYRDSWLNPIITNLEYFEAQIIPIQKEEYDILIPTIQNAPIPVEEEEEEIVIPEPINPADEITLEYVRAAKINEMSRACNQVIENGFDVEIGGETHHFSLTVQDQLNLITLSSMAAQGMEQIPYHADGELCKFYTAAEINTIVNQATAWKTYHTTYYNALKAYINSLQTIEEIGAITYGTQLPEEYQTDVYRALVNE